MFQAAFIDWVLKLAKLMSNQLLIKPNKKALVFNKSFFV